GGGRVAAHDGLVRWEAVHGAAVAVSVENSALTVRRSRILLRIAYDPRTGQRFLSNAVWPGEVRRQGVIVVEDVHVPAQWQLFEIIYTRDGLCFCFGLR